MGAIVIAPTSRPPIDVHVTPRGRIIIVPAVWPPELDADDVDLLAERLTAAAAQSRAKANGHRVGRNTETSGPPAFDDFKQGT
jgi:hypothetical protein